MGGGFGGKEVRNVLVTLATAVAAMDLRVPVRTVMNRQDDMMATGGRHPFLCTYKVGFNADGRIVGVAAKLYSGAGNSLDVSPFVMERAVMTLDSGYSIPNWRIEGWVCKTDLASNTAFRGFGTPQAALFCENIIDAVAESLDKSPLEVKRLFISIRRTTCRYNFFFFQQIRQMHLKEEGDITPCGWKLENVTLKRFPVFVQEGLQFYININSTGAGKNVFKTLPISQDWPKLRSGTQRTDGRSVGWP